MSRFTNALNHEELRSTTDITLIESPRTTYLNEQSMSPNARANSAVPNTSGNSDKLADRCELIAKRISRKHPATFRSSNAADMHKTDIEHHALSEADEDLTGICLCQPEPKIPRPRNGK